MTLPKAISDAIDAYQKRCADVVASVALKQSAESVAMTCRDVNHARAALERAIEEHVAPVAAPTEAEIEAWHVKVTDALLRLGVGTFDPVWELIDKVARALMRRAAAAKKLMECQFGDIGSSKHARYEVYTTPVLGWSVGEPLPNLSVEVDGKVTRYVPEAAAAKPAQVSAPSRAIAEWKKSATSEPCEHPKHANRDVRQLGFFVSMAEIDEAVRMMQEAFRGEAYYCCNGRECGCMGVTVAEYALSQRSGPATPAPSALERLRERVAKR